MSDDDILTGFVLEGRCFTLEELCAAGALEPDWLLRHIEEGLFPAPEGARTEWRFTAVGLHLGRAVKNSAKLGVSVEIFGGLVLIGISEDSF